MLRLFQIHIAALDQAAPFPADQFQQFISPLRQFFPELESLLQMFRMLHG